MWNVLEVLRKFEIGVQMYEQEGGNVLNVMLGLIEVC